MAAPITRIDPAATATLVAQDMSRPLRDIAPIPIATGIERESQLRAPMLRAATPDFVDPVAQTFALPAQMPAPNMAFDGLGAGFVGPAGTFSADADPPDTNGDVGPDHYVQSVNVAFAVFSKTGTPLFGPASIRTLWSGFGGQCETTDDGDPLVKYDQAAKRWIVSQFALQTPNMECIAVSATADPLGAWHRYAFSYTTDIDYPKMGIGPDAYYITQNTSHGTTICAFQREAMLAGTMAKSQCFTSTVFGMMPADVSGPTMPAAGSPEYVLALGTDALRFWKLKIDWTTPTNSALTGPTLISVAPFSQPTRIAQPGTTTTLDAIGEQLMYGVAWRQFADHESLVATHTVSTGGHIGLRWYELRNPAGTPLVFDQGTYVPDANQRWMGSINIDRMGDIALGFSVAGGVKPSIHYAGRLAGDPAGMLAQSETALIDGTGVKTDSFSPSRWGDYSTMSVDPADDCTFWYTQEYLVANGANWHTRIGSFKFESCHAAGDGSGSGSGFDGSGSGTGSGSGDDGSKADNAGCGGCTSAGGAGNVSLVIVLLTFGARRRRKRSA